MSNRTLGLMMGAVALLIVAVAVVFVLVLAGGDGDDVDVDVDVNVDTDVGNTDAGDGEAAATEAAATAAPREDSRSGSGSGICADNRLITFGDDPATVFDPIQVGDASTAEYTAEIFGGLVTLDLDLNVVPDIAERWEISEGGRVYTFFLRDDVVFHNGRRVTADDVKYSLERAADPANFSPTVLDYLGDITGVRDKFNGRADEISGVRVIDEYTLRIELETPISYFLQQLTYTVAYVVDREQIAQDPDGWTRNPNGTGPFRVKVFRPLEEIVLVPNDRYHLGPPKLDEVVFALSGGSLSTRFENDEIHVALVPPAELTGVLSGESSLSEYYVPVPPARLLLPRLQRERAALRRPARAAGVRPRHQPRGHQRGACSSTPPSSPTASCRPRCPATARPSPPTSTDPARAAELLSQSRYATDMPRIILTFQRQRRRPARHAAGLPAAVARGARRRGRESRPSSGPAYLRELRRGELQMYAAGWIADYPDPENFVGKLFASDSRLNHGGYSNAEVDALLAEAATLQDQEARYRLYHQAEQLIIDDAPVIPTFWFINHYLVRECVQNWVDPGTIVPKYRYVENRHLGRVGRSEPGARGPTSSGGCCGPCR